MHDVKIEMETKHLIDEEIVAIKRTHFVLTHEVRTALKNVLTYVKRQKNDPKRGVLGRFWYNQRDSNS